MYPATDTDASLVLDLGTLAEATPPWPSGSLDDALIVSGLTFLTIRGIMLAIGWNLFILLVLSNFQDI